jgi:hypothetical protein
VIDKYLLLLCRKGLRRSSLRSVYRPLLRYAGGLDQETRTPFWYAARGTKKPSG